MTDYEDVIDALKTHLQGKFTYVDDVIYVKDISEIPARGNELILLAQAEPYYTSESRINNYVKQTYAVQVICMVRTTQSRYTAARHGRSGTGIWEFDMAVRQQLMNSTLSSVLDQYPGMNLTPSVALDWGKDIEATIFTFYGMKTELRT